MKNRLFHHLTAVMVSIAMLSIVPQCHLTAAEEAFTESDEIETEAEPAYTIDNIRDYVVGLNEPVELSDGTMRPAINFDNAATTPALQPVKYSNKVNRFAERKQLDHYAVYLLVCSKVKIIP